MPGFGELTEPTRALLQEIAAGDGHEGLRSLALASLFGGYRDRQETRGLLPYLEDPSAHVRITAAEAILRIDPSPVAERVLDLIGKCRDPWESKCLMEELISSGASLRDHSAKVLQIVMDQSDWYTASLAAQSLLAAQPPIHVRGELERSMQFRFTQLGEGVWLDEIYLAGDRQVLRSLPEYLASRPKSVETVLLSLSHLVGRWNSTRGAARNHEDYPHVLRAIDHVLETATTDYALYQAALVLVAVGEQERLLRLHSRLTRQESREIIEDLAARADLKISFPQRATPASQNTSSPENK